MLVEDILTPPFDDNAVYVYRKNVADLLEYAVFAFHVRKISLSIICAKSVIS